MSTDVQTPFRGTPLVPLKVSLADKPLDRQIRGWRAVPAAVFQGRGSHKGSVCSQTPDDDEYGTPKKDIRFA